ncbi:MAG: pyridoxal-dependent decarboxylase [Alphaproteobacteria bacterium]|nr:pyridoxal-dependent decarboxylase [Alphaproteobacteria bacterium]
MTAPEHGSGSAADDPFTDVLAAIDQAHRLAADYLSGLRDRPVGQSVTPEEMTAALDEPLPEDGMPIAAVLEGWLGRAGKGIVASPGPRFFGFVNGGSTPAGLAGDWIAAALDQNAGMWLGSPAAVHTELVALRWLKELFGLPADWVGGLTTGASMANLVGLGAARQWASVRLGFDAGRDGLAGATPIRVLSSTEIHSSARKALGVLGLGRATVEEIPAPGGVIDLDGLREALARLDGPAIVVASAGEVNTGAFDDLAAMADLCTAHEPGAWLHVDGAFGLFAALSPAHAHLVAGVDRADSVAVDGHKWLNVPYDCGFALVRDGEALRGAFAASGAYIAPAHTDSWDPLTHVPEMSRRFRALAVWCTLKSLGRQGYRAIVERCCANAAAFGTWVDAQPDLELMAPVPLNIVCFRLAPPGVPADRRDDINRRAVTALQQDGRAFVTGTVWRGRAAIRAAFDNWATGPADVEILQTAVAEIAKRDL